MTVDDLPEGAREADRLGEQMLSGYKPSSIINHAVLTTGLEHFRTQCDPNSCPERKFWDLVTTNPFFATLLYTEQQRDEADAKISEITEENTVMVTDLFVGLSTWLNTGVGDVDALDEMVSMGEAYRTWAQIRVKDVLEGTPPEAPGDALAQGLLWEGFQAGMMFLQMLELRERG